MKVNVKEIKNAIQEFGVLLGDEMEGLVAKTMQQDFWKKYERFELMIAWECFVDEVNRVDTMINLHDELCGITDEEWAMILGDENDEGDN